MSFEIPGADARLHLLHANRDAVSVMLARAAVSGLAPEDAVVLIVDQQDPVGAELAQAAAEKAGLDASIEAERVQRRGGEIPTGIIVVPLAGARILFAEGHPEVARGLARRPAASQVRVVVISEDAAMLITRRCHFELEPGAMPGARRAPYLGRETPDAEAAVPADVEGGASSAVRARRR